MGDSDIFDGCARLGPGGSIETLVVQGPDAEDFLQRLISCDLNAVQPGVGSRGTLLGGKGRIVAYFDVHPDHPTSYVGIKEMILKGALDQPVFAKDMSYYVSDYIDKDPGFVPRRCSTARSCSPRPHGSGAPLS